MSVKLNFGIIGIGNWGKNLIRDFSKYGNIEKCTNTGNHKNIRWVKTNYPSIEYVSFPTPPDTFNAIPPSLNP